MDENDQLHKELLEDQEKIQVLSEKMANETDPEKLMEMAEELRAMAGVLQAKAAAYGAQMALHAREPDVGDIRVKLTEEQMRAVSAETGEHLEEVVFRKRPRRTMGSMPKMPPDIVLAEAIRQGHAKAREKIARAQGKAEIEASFAALEANAASDEMKKFIQDARENPMIKDILEN